MVCGYCHSLLISTSVVQNGNSLTDSGVLIDAAMCWYLECLFRNIFELHCSNGPKMMVAGHRIIRLLLLLCYVKRKSYEKLRYTQFIKRPRVSVRSGRILSYQTKTEMISMMQNVNGSILLNIVIIVSFYRHQQWSTIYNFWEYDFVTMQ